VCGARIGQTLRRISLRLMLPAFFSVLLLIFIRAFESFEIPALVGLPGDIRVLTTAILLDAQRMPPTYGRAGAFSVLLMLVVAGTLYVYFRVTRDESSFHTITGKAIGPPWFPSVAGAISPPGDCSFTLSFFWRCRF
jgi:iron(III) transport system permease protein